MRQAQQQQRASGHAKVSYPTALLLYFKPLEVWDSLVSVSGCFADTLTIPYSLTACGRHILIFSFSCWSITMIFVGLESVSIFQMISEKGHGSPHRDKSKWDFRPSIRKCFGQKALPWPLKFLQLCRGWAPTWQPGSSS